MRSLNFSLAVLAMMVAAWSAGCGSSNPDPVANPTTVDNIRGTTSSGTSSTAGSTTTAPKGEGWGSLKGVFVLAGDPPPASTLSTGGKDAAVCDKHPIPDETLVVDAGSKGIANIVVYARKTSRVHESQSKEPTDPAVFDQKECVFLSHVLPVRVGQTVQIKNSDPIGHNTNISPAGDSPSNSLLAGGTESTYTFARAQTEPVAVTCNIHPWMKAYIMPRKDGYLAVTNKLGEFEIANLPAGEEVEFQVWHEKPRNLAAKPEWAQGRFKVTIPKDGVMDLGKIEVPASAFQ